MLEQQGRSRAEKPRVLVVDDELFFSVRIETTLIRLGYEVSVIGDGELAVAQAAALKPALVIVHFSNRLSPTDVIRRIKAQTDAPPLLCFMPHKQMPELRPLAKDAGADLVVANSALVLRLPQLAARLAPLDGSAVGSQAAEAFLEDEEEV